MRIKFSLGLLLLNLVTIAASLVAIFLPNDILRVVLGLPFVLFFPGCVLLLALFPAKKAIKVFERTVLSFGFSIVMVAIIGIILNYAWKITAETIVYSLLIFTFVMSIVAWIRSRRFSEQDQASFEFRFKMPGLGRSPWEKALSVVLVISVICVLSAFGYAFAKPKNGEKFTEFYILGPGGIAADYPGDLVIGDTAKVTVGIINQEQKTANYRVEIFLAGIQIENLGPISLGYEQKWEQEVSITPETTGENQKVEFQLFKEGEENPGNLLHFWLNVKEKT